MLTESKPTPSKFCIALPQILAVTVKNILLLGFGQTLGIATIIIPALSGQGHEETKESSDFTLTETQISWISSINLMCIPIGCIFSGAFTQPIGRRRAMQLVNLPLSVAWLMLYFSQNVNHIFASLCLTGLSGGLMEAPVLTYVAEITQPHLRGMLAATGSAFVILGVSSQFLMGTYFNWRTVALICSILPIISIILLMFVPESPHWLITKKRYEEAQKSLAWLRGWVPVAMVEKEYQELLGIQRKQTSEKKNGCSFGGVKRFLGREFLRPFGIVSLCFFVGHFSGMTTLQTYAVFIFNNLKAPINKYYATIFLGVCEFLGTIFCVIFVHHVGKRKILFFSTIGCGLCFLGTATYAHFIHLVPGTIANMTIMNPRNLNDTMLSNISDSRNGTFNVYALETRSSLIADLVDANTSSAMSDIIYISANESSDHHHHHLNGTMTNAESLADPIENHYLWLPLTLLLGSAFLSHAGIRLIPWMLIGEIFPTKVRSAASGFAGGIGYIFGFLANVSFLNMTKLLTLPGTFWFYSAVSLIGTIILYFVMPETEGRTLMEIEAHYTGGEKLTYARKLKKQKKRSEADTELSVSAQVNAAFENDNPITASATIQNSIQKIHDAEINAKTLGLNQAVVSIQNQEISPKMRYKLSDNNSFVTKL